MRVKLGENLPAAVANILTNLGHDVDTVADEDLAGHPDSAVWQGAQNAKRFLITQDLDFSDTSQFAPGSHHGLFLVSPTSPGRRAEVRRRAAAVDS